MATAAALAVNTVPTRLISIILRKNAAGIGTLPAHQARGRADAGAIDGRVDSAHALSGLRDRGIDRGFVGDVGGDEYARSPSAAAADAPCASFTSSSATCPPDFTIRPATARPSPEAPPVTTACDSLNCTDLRRYFRLMVVFTPPDVPLSSNQRAVTVLVCV